MSAIASQPAHEDHGTGLGPAFTAARARLGLVAALFGLAALAWWSTAERMSGVDAGPGTDLGAVAWFLGVWIVMMAAMMFPSVSPTVALYARMARSGPRIAPVVFASGYLATWTAAGLAAYSLFKLGDRLLGDQLAWHAAGRWLAGGILVLAAAYELTPMKDVCLGTCRSPLGFLLRTWRSGTRGALEMGARDGAWCVGCCWALMASLFALGVMSLAWMAFVAALIALEKTVPFGRAITYATAALLFALGLALLATPDAIPGLTVPNDGATMDGEMLSVPSHHASVYS
jgi:predicted metal-binding membrane protein